MLRLWQHLRRSGENWGGGGNRAAPRTSVNFLRGCIWWMDKIRFAPPGICGLPARGFHVARTLRFKWEVVDPGLTPNGWRSSISWRPLTKTKEIQINKSCSSQVAEQVVLASLSVITLRHYWPTQRIEPPGVPCFQFKGFWSLPHQPSQMLPTLHAQAVAGGCTGMELPGVWTFSFVSRKRESTCGATTCIHFAVLRSSRRPYSACLYTDYCMYSAI